MGHSGIDWDLCSPYSLDEVQFRAIELTLQGLSDKRIAEILSINRRTLWRWKTLSDEYRLALADARLQLQSLVMDRHRDLVLRALVVLDKFLDDPAENNRFRAAHVLLTMAGRIQPMPAVTPMLPEPTPQPMPEPDLPYKMG